MRLHNLPLAFLFIFCFQICAASGAKYYPDDEEINAILDSSSGCSEEEEEEADEELFGSTPDGPSSASPHLFKSFEQLESTSEIWPDGFYRNMSICQHEIFPWKVYKLEGPDECPPNTTIAVGQYRNAQNESGWGILEVETFAPFSQELQAYAAGLVEGSLSKMQIYYHHKNTVSGLCKNQTEYCQKLYRYLADNLAWIKSQVMAKPPSDIYWRQVNLTFTQLTGINDGYGKEKDSGYVPHVQFYITPVFMLQLSGEIYDLDHLFKKQPNARQNAQMDDEDPGHCSGFVKVADGNKDLLMSHVAMAGYQTMNRVAKLYKFAYDKKNVPGNIVSFSGYAGVLASVDDYTLTSAGLLSVETTIAVFNESLYKEYVKPKGQLHCWIRSYISNQLAATAHDWVQIFAQHNSGTYNNQWTVTDFKRFKPGQELPTTDLVWILEQIPGTCVSRDVTWFLRKYGYWPSYNIPYLSKISELSGFSWKGNMNNWWRWGYSPRARIFQRDHGSVQNISTLQNLMRYNNYAHDEYSKCKCTPPYTAEAGISARGDLNPSNGTYEIPGMGFRNHGSLDYKGTNYELFKQMRLELIGGPTYGGPGNLPYFSWATTKVDAPHMGQPTNWNFKPFVTLWRTKVDVDMGEGNEEDD